MQFINRHSLIVGGALVALLGAAVGLLWRPVVGAAIALGGALGFTAMWQALRTGPSTLTSPEDLRRLIGSGTPLLVELYSDT
jgi:hypothetical protein